MRTITCVLLLSTATLAAAQPPTDLADSLRRLDTAFAPPGSALAKELKDMLGKELRARRDVVNLRESKAWRSIHSKADWEKYRDVRIQALRASLGSFPQVPKDLKVRVTGKLAGPGFVIENLVYESRPGVLVTANLYRPAAAKQAMPGILIIHSHHNPKTQGELQDMGMTWARQGCMVLIPDQLGHGERRQHPFIDAGSYQGAFKPSRQDYYFRYNTGMQLHLIGDSLIGWMAWDMMRGVDLLLSKPGIDPKRIVLLGSVAGGGDPCAVTAALDRRIAAAAPFNFGGPQPETRFPLPENAEDAFNYAGGGSWEMTRSLRLSGRDGFLPWVIVGAVAPRGLVYAHEFAWVPERDPVWKRLQTIYGFYDAPDRLSSVAGRGKVTGKPPESTHCNNIGAVHRKQIYPAFQKWFGMPEPAQEYQKRFSADELRCVTPASGVVLPSLVEVAGKLGNERAAAARKELSTLAIDQRRQKLRADWSRLLGNVEPAKAIALEFREEKLGKNGRVRWLLLQANGPDQTIPMLMLLPDARADKYPVVVALAQGGKQAFLKHRADAIAKLLESGVAVCLPDVRGTGETRAGDDRGRQTAATSYSATDLMLGGTFVGERLRDLRSVLAFLKKNGADPKRIALWGDSFAPVNATNGPLTVPLDAAKVPPGSEPLGGLLALFGALYEPDVQAVYARGGLTGYQSVLQSQFCYLPHDVIVPGALTAGDLCDVAAALAPKPLRLEGLVDGLNRRVTATVLNEIHEPVRKTYSAAGAGIQLSVQETVSSATDLAGWLVRHLK